MDTIVDKSPVSYDTAMQNSIEQYTSVLDFPESLIPTSIPPDVKEQVLFVLFGCVPKSCANGNLQTVIQSVVLSHRIDDLVDIYKNHADFRATLVQVFDSLQEGFAQGEKIDTGKYIDRAYDEATLILFSLDPAIEQELALVESSIDGGNEGDNTDFNKLVYRASVLKLIVAGLAQTTPAWERTNGVPIAQATSIQSSLVATYAQLNTIFITDKRLKSLYSDLNPEVLIAHASGLLEQFEGFNGLRVNPALTLLETTFLGILVFLNNWSKEQSDNGAMFYNKTSPDDYIYLLSESIPLLQEKLFELYRLDPEFARQKIFRLHAAITLFDRNEGAHSFQNFPQGFESIAEWYKAVNLHNTSKSC
jgi:hypothetical protein